jgi:hypothetical protein
LYIDTPFKIRAILDHDPRRLDIAHQARILPNLDSVRGIHIAMDRPENDDLVRLHSRLNLSVRADRETVFLEFDGPFYLSIDREILAAEDLALDHNRLANDGRSAGLGSAVTWCW